MMLSTLLFAQHHKGGGRPHDRTETMKTELSLNDNQFAAIKGINEKYADQFASLRKDSIQTHDQKRAAGKALRQKREQEISDVLTPEQNTKWKAYKAEQKAKHKAERKEARERYQAEMKSALSLSDDQVSRMNDAGKAFHQKLRKAKKEGKTDKAEFKKLKEEHEASVKSILTEEQYQKWISFRKDKKDKKKGSHRGRK